MIKKHIIYLINSKVNKHVLTSDLKKHEQLRVSLLHGTSRETEKTQGCHQYHQQRSSVDSEERRDFHYYHKTNLLAGRFIQLCDLSHFF